MSFVNAAEVTVPTNALELRAFIFLFNRHEKIHAVKYTYNEVDHALTIPRMLELTMYITGYKTLDPVFHAVIDTATSSGQNVTLQGVERNGDLFSFMVLSKTGQPTGVMLKVKLAGILSGIVKDAHFYLNTITGEVSRDLAKRQPRPIPVDHAVTPSPIRKPVEVPTTIPTPEPLLVLTPPRHVLERPLATKPSKTRRTMNNKERDQLIRDAIGRGIDTKIVARNHGVSGGRISQIAPISVYGPDAIRKRNESS